jgi:sialate O-acetylesterase
MWCEAIFRRLAHPALAAALLALWWAPAPAVHGDVVVPAIFGSHMVLQRDQKDRVWGWASPGENVTVKIGGQTQATTAGTDGAWQVMLDPLPVGGPHTLSIEGKNTLKFDDVLVGEVWICSGQSNMQWPVAAANDADLEIATAKYPQIRFITVPNRGTQEPQKDFQGKWQPARPNTVGGLTAVGYFFGRRLHQMLDVPIGLILAADAEYAPLLKRWEKLEKDFADWKTAVAKAKTEGTPPPKAPDHIEQQMNGNARPGNIYNGVLKPTIGYGIRGVVWYQGESNAARAYQYRNLFPLMIKSWRDEWGQGAFSFYWVQLADFLAESPEPKDSMWAELREAQTMTMKLPKTGEAVIIDLGEGKDIHPKNKQGVADRLARWALARDYQVKIACQSPAYQAMEKHANKIVLKFDHVGGGLKPFDVNDPRGFAIAGSDRKFVSAKAKIVGPATVEVWSDSVSEPAAVRYAWADNPVCNLYSAEGLPLTPFRTDQWPGVTVHNVE